MTPKPKVSQAVGDLMDFQKDEFVSSFCFLEQTP